MNVFEAVSLSLRLNDVFHSVVDSHWGASIVHNLVGVVTYYGKHYFTFILHSKLKQWIYFDDVTIKEIGPRWEQVIDKCCRGRYQPLLLLYATSTSTPINIENAPNIVTQFINNEELKNSKKMYVVNSENSNHKRRLFTPNSKKLLINTTTRRAITPNLDSPPYIHTQNHVYKDYQNCTNVNNISSQVSIILCHCY
jgi:hypothetical protein